MGSGAVGAQPAPVPCKAPIAETTARTLLIVRAAITDVDNRAAVDGGHAYRVRVLEVLQGSHSEPMLSFQAGGWAWRVPFERGDETLLFLNRADGAHGAAGHVSMSGEGGAPLAFRLDAGRLAVVGNVTLPSWSGCTLGDVKAALSSR